jgi:hypothetical protein
VARRTLTRMFATSTLHIDLGREVPPEEYRRLVVAVWAVLMSAGHERTATIAHDGTVTAEEISETLEELIQTCPWGW